MKLESKIIQHSFFKKHGMDRNTFENTNTKFEIDIHNKYRDASSIINFINLKGHGNYEKMRLLVFDKTQSVVLINENEISKTLPFTSILDFRTNVETDVIREATAHTVSKNYYSGIGKTLFFGIGKQKGKTVFHEAKTANRYTITLVLNSLKSPEFILYFGLNKQEYERAISLLTIIISRNKSIVPPPIDNYIPYSIKNQ